MDCEPTCAGDCSVQYWSRQIKALYRLFTYKNMSACSWPTNNFLVECCLRRTWATLTGQYSHAILCQHGQYNIVQVIFLEEKLSVCHELTLHRWFPSAMFVQTDPDNIVHYWTGALLKQYTGKILCNAVLEASGNIAQKKKSFQCFLNTLETLDR